MPCKVLRVEIQAGDIVVKDQALVVVESMKMEMVVRSPGEGKVKRVVHGAGDICAMGTALVEFEEESTKD
jgi:3-methylcrotonyl-CoA carboxylase alpha subunit